MKLSPHARALAAGLVWVTGGAVLLYRGWFPFWERTCEQSPGWAVPALLIGLLIGVAKGWFVLRKTARRMIRRIEASPGPEPFWKMYPPMFYLLILGMIGFGIALRHFLGDRYPGLILAVYLGIGAALLVSSVPYFQAAGRLRGSQAQATV